jgi:hypothetical protein
MVDNCDTFHHVTENDECNTIAHNSGISLSQSYIWISAVGIGLRETLEGVLCVCLDCWRESYYYDFDYD